MEKVRALLNTTSLLVLINASIKYNQIFKTIKKIWHMQEFGLEIHSGEVIRKQPQSGVILLHTTHQLVHIYASTKYYQNISNH